MQERGASVGDYEAPLFLAWQLTNRCEAKCLACCEESGPDKRWSDELTEAEALRVAREAVELKIPYAAFGGGEPMSVPHVWKVFEILRKGGVSLKIETNGLPIDDAAADRLKDLGVDCIQISLDGSTKERHERVRPGGDFDGVVGCLERLVKRGLEPEVVFVPTKLNLEDGPAIFDFAATLGARTFVTGPMMRLGRAAAAWSTLAPSTAEWQSCAAKLEERRKESPWVKLSVYPWDIVEEVRVRRESPQAMVLVVPNGKVKLLNALPFYCGDLRELSLGQAWKKLGRAWRSPELKDFTDRLLQDPTLLKHANECWPVPTTSGRAPAAV